MRLRNRVDFVRVQEKGRKVRDDVSLVAFLPRAEPGPSRYGVTVSKKVGGAVARTRVKRWFREAIRKERAEFEGAASGNAFDVVFIAHPSVVGADAQRVQGSVRRSFQLIAGRAR